MIWAEKEVPSLELCKRLKELGFPQSSGGWYWRVDEYKKWLSFYTDSEYKHRIPNEIFIKAPTCREMIEWISKVEPYHIISYKSITPKRLAKELICLAKNRRVKFKEVKDEKETNC